MATKEAGRGLQRVEQRPKGYRIFLIDAGWKTPVREAVIANLGLFRDFLEEHEVYLLGPDNAIELFKKRPGLIGNAPALVVLEPPHLATPHLPHGVSVNLGRAKTEAQAIRLMRWMCEILANRAAARRLDDVVRESAHREGIMGAVEIITEMAASRVEDI